MLKNIESTLTAHRDKARALQMKAYMKNKFEFLGIPSPERKRLMREVYATIKKISKPEALDLVNALWQMECREYQYVAMEILDRLTKKLDAGDTARVEKWILEKSWWDTVDHLAARQVGHLFRHSQIRDTYLQDWLDSENIWLNRCCLLYQLFYKEDTDWPALQAYIGALKHKNEFFIQKAIGWALRQYSKTNPADVSAYIKIHPLSGLASREGLKWILKNSE